MTLQLFCPVMLCSFQYDTYEKKLGCKCRPEVLDVSWVQSDLMAHPISTSFWLQQQNSSLAVTFGLPRCFYYTAARKFKSYCDGLFPPCKPNNSTEGGLKLKLLYKPLSSDFFPSKERFLETPLADRFQPRWVFPQLSIYAPPLKPRVSRYGGGFPGNCWGGGFFGHDGRQQHLKHKFTPAAWDRVELMRRDKVAACFQLEMFRKALFLCGLLGICCYFEHYPYQIFNSLNCCNRTRLAIRTSANWNHTFNKYGRKWGSITSNSFRQCLFPPDFFSANLIFFPL